MKPTDPIHALPTTVFPPPAIPSMRSSLPPDDTPAPRCHMAFAPGSTHPTSGELEDLLRRRLRIAVLLVLVPFVYYFVKNLIDPAPAFYGAGTLQAAHVWFIVLTLAATALLWSRIRLSVRELRIVEFGLFGMTAGFFALLQFYIFCLERVCNIGAAPPEVVRLAIGSSAIRWFFLIVIYGVFIPNTWKRCALAAGLTALLPIGLTALSALDHERLNHEVLSALSDMTVLMGVAVAVAVFGSYRIQALQEQAQEARQLGQYRLKQRLGSGGMGEVYLAEHLMLRRPCAVKLIRPENASDGKSLRRFEREVRAMATLTHWNTVEVFDYGHADDGTFYYVMEYLPGQTLDALVVRHGPLPPGRAVHFLRQVCRALREAHGIGLLHRDIKPGNVLACERGGVHDVAKLLDFGLVQDGAATAGADRLTMIGSIVGSPPYMSPEQAAGRPLDSRSDIYSVGTLAYFLLTGRPPFPRETAMEMVMAHAYEPVPAFDSVLPGLPPDLEAVIRRCLEKDPAKRWPDAYTLERALASCVCAGEWSDEQAEAWWRGLRGGEQATAPSFSVPVTPVLAESPVPAG
jgi:serine/threonine-protein kinase